jgi:uncharacterized membrane protein YphA (DoxX/SURF4 family)
MRTNPFYDTWLFVIGSTGDYQKLGAFKWVFVVLFLVLIIASAWIAWTNWREDPAQRNGRDLTTLVCRVLIGCMWFQGCLWKLPFPISDGFQYWTGEIAGNAAFAFHRALATEVYLPYLVVIQPIVFLAELAFGASLILGFAVRLFALLAVLHTLHLWLGLYRESSEWPWEFIFLAVALALFVAYAAGRSLGADALLRRRAKPGTLVGRVLSLIS